MSFKLKNDSKRSFQFGTAKNLKLFKPGEVAIFTDETAASLLKHRGVIDLDNLTVSYDQTKVQDFSDADDAHAEKATDKTVKVGKK